MTWDTGQDRKHKTRTQFMGHRTGQKTQDKDTVHGSQDTGHRT